jgi:hypothetical protein
LLGPHDGRLAGTDAIPDEKVFPPRLWQPGEIVDDVRELRLPTDLPSGFYHLRIGTYYLEPSGNQITPITGRSRDASDSGVSALSWRIRPDVSRIGDATQVDVSFGGEVRLKGYDVHASTSLIDVQTYWVSDSQLSRRLVISVQVIDSSGKLVAQNDHEPVDGNFPTTAWNPGEIIRDDRTIGLSAPWDPANRVIVIVYDRESLSRLPVVNSLVSSSDFFTLSTK